MTGGLLIAAAGTGHGSVSAGDTAWMLIATALVMMMTPALGLFYSGLVRAKSTLNTFMMSLVALGIVTITWTLLGYSLAFSHTANGFIGGFHFALLAHVGFGAQPGTHIPQLVYFAFEATFAIITAALVSGAVVERVRFPAFLVFMTLWSLLVYPVLAHWVWGGGWLAQHGVLDFAGGVPVEMGSGFAAAAAAIAVGARHDYGRKALLPHNGMYVLMGAGLLWFGWFGFNGGSGFSTGHASVLAFVNTLLAPAATLTVWLALEFRANGRPTAIGAATAVVVGCVGITPAAGYISPVAALLLGALAALPSYAVILWRPRTRLDESLDVLGAHGVAGFCGMIFIGLFAQRSWNGVANGALFGHLGQLLWQAIAATAGPAYAFLATFALLKLVGRVMPLRVEPAGEALGMDVLQHGEEAYSTGEGAILLHPDELDPAPPRRPRVGAEV
ncbi:ammonium transporter [Conexibacter sp. DBS9H8]|uniref:ammonium transporter n=1 Tax=Conexibacter sp. DBS9H8 TaxID=2937801 RepID=UPI00200BABA4|nr:ammonium transporter [Conexibacter sp. DBS9H8]